MRLRHNEDVVIEHHLPITLESSNVNSDTDLTQVVKSSRKKYRCVNLNQKVTV